MLVTLARLSIDVEADVFVLRNRGRQVAAALGLDPQDQVRVATALSEAGREALDSGGASSATFQVELGVRCTLVVDIACGGPLVPEDGGLTPGLTGASRLMDEVLVHVASTSTHLVLKKECPPDQRLDEARLAEVRGLLAASDRPSPLDELRSQNAELVSAMEELSAHRELLLALNAELEETNRGVMAMYGQLSAELEETNRGVVALYAELDEKSVQLQLASESKSRFFASVSHELRTPVNSVLAIGKLLLEPDGDPPTAEQRRQLRLVVNSATDLLNLVNELLDLARAEAGRLQPEPVDVALSTLFAELRGVMRPLLSDGVELEVSVPDDLPAVRTDPVLLGQVLRNLLANAVKFTERGSVRLSVRLRDSAQHVEIEVADTGIGIAQEDLGRVFEEFFQVRGPLQSRRRGSGLGLAYVRRVVQVLGGELALESVLGTGTTVSVRLPLHWLTPNEPRLPAAGEVVVGTVLVVDDDEVFREVLRGMLQGSTTRVIEAGGVASAREALRALVPDVIFLDLLMPDANGSELLAELGRDPRLAHVPVIILTSMELDQLAVAGLGAATAILPKHALSPEEVVRALVAVQAGGE